MQNELLNKTNQNYELSRLADFIIENYQDKLKDYFSLIRSGDCELLEEDLYVFENVKNVVIDYLVRKGYSFDQIYAGLADNDLELFCKRVCTNIRGKEDNFKVQLQSRKVKINKDVFNKVKSAAIVFALAFGAKQVASNINDNSLEKNVSKNLGVIASVNEGYNDSLNIVEQNTYTKAATANTLEREEIDLSKVVDDIIIICKKDPKLLDVTLNNIYFDIKVNRLHKMDVIINSLKTKASQDESLLPIYNEIKDYDIFLDYLIKKGYASPSDNNYYELQKDIEYYKTVSSNYIPFESLNEDAKKRVETVIDKYDDAKQGLYEEYQDEIQNLANEVSGGRRV